MRRANECIVQQSRVGFSELKQQKLHKILVQNAISMSLFANLMIMYLENPEGSIINLLQN